MSRPRRTRLAVIIFRDYVYLLARVTGKLVIPMNILLNDRVMNESGFLSRMVSRRVSAPITLSEAPGMICPEQFHDLWSRTTESPGEVRLAMAVLVRAIEDLRSFRGSAEGSEAQQLYRQAHRWVASNDREWPFSFVNVAEILNISLTRMRTRLENDAPHCSRASRHYGAQLFRGDTRPRKASALQSK